MSKFDLNDLMKNAKGLMDQAQQKLEKITAQGESGAGMVKVTMNAHHEVTELNISDDLLKEDKEIIVDLIRAAINDANQKVNKASQENMMSLGSILGGTDKDDQ